MTFPLLTNPMAQIDMYSDPSANGFVSVARYNNAQMIYRGEIGQMYGVRLLLAPAIPIALTTRGAGSNSAATAAGGIRQGLSSTVTGCRAYLVAPDAFYNLEHEDSGLEVIHHPPGSSGSVSDPANHVGSVTVKMRWGTLPAPAAEKRLSACIFDELHAQPNRDLWDVMTFGAGDARVQPIWWIITTAGDDPDRVSIGWEQHEYARRLLAGEIYDPTWYPVIYGYEGDDIYNPNNWEIANPSLGTTFTLESVQEQADKAMNKPADERLFRWLRLNQWITTKLTTWLPLSLFDDTVGEWDRRDLIGKDCYMGLDLSSTTDLSALCLVFPPQGTQLDWRVIWECWIPGDNMQERIKTDHIPYDVWAKQGWITGGQLCFAR